MSDNVEHQKHNYKMDLVFTVLSRGLGNKVVDICDKNGVNVSLMFPGRGTATSSILEMFGLGSTEKDIVISCIRSERSPAIIANIAEKLNFSKPGTGISFSVPMQSVAGAKVLQFLTTASFEEDRNDG